MDLPHENSHGVGCRNLMYWLCRPCSQYDTKQSKRLITMTTACLQEKRSWDDDVDVVDGKYCLGCCYCNTMVVE
jgi:hypothetical protein